MDRDLILQVDQFAPGTLFILEQILHWLAKNLDRAISIKRELLQDRCPGSVGKEPKIIWIQMINCPFIKRHPFFTYNLVVELRKQFNKLLIQEAKKSKYSLVMSISDLTGDLSNFNEYGNLTFEGKCQFWKQVDLQIRKLETDPQTSLQPWNTSTPAGSNTFHHKVRKEHIPQKGYQNVHHPKIQPPQQSSHCRNRSSSSFSGDGNIWGQAAVVSDKIHKSKLYYH